MKVKFLQAHKGDSILISFVDAEGLGRNIIIDGGTSATYYNVSYNKAGPLKVEIDKIIERDEKVDLLILSHIDNDHIEGLLKWFSIDKQVPELVKSVWFNSGKTISKTYEELENSGLQLNINIRGDVAYTGVPEALEFEKFLLERQLWKYDIVKTGDQENVHGFTLKVLTPSVRQLKKLVKEYEKHTDISSYTSGSSSNWDKSIKSIIQEEAKSNFKFKQDSSVKNGSSITTLCSFQNKNFLFLADGHPKEILKSLKSLGYSKSNPVEVELFQIAHHGSKANMNKELLEVVKTNNYVISTDSSSHGHPHKEVIARIISVNPKAIIHFNYTYVRENVFIDQDFMDFPDFKTRLIAEYEIENDRR
jgi:beta-lactamase superfamily II metal-dependent hydrolase